MSVDLALLVVRSLRSSLSSPHSSRHSLGIAVPEMTPFWSFACQCIELLFPCIDQTNMYSLLGVQSRRRADQARSADMSKHPSLLGRMGGHQDGTISFWTPKEDRKTSKSFLCGDSHLVSSGCRESSPSRDLWLASLRSCSPSDAGKDSPFGHLRLSRASSLHSRTPSPDDCQLSSSSPVSIWTWDRINTR